ncbi:MAG: SDR family NAD(P)-dependent oxidoreductase [Chloroflexi bacterium]|nr:SDR family NAD(P)-dependent oxidoreductase [Chloroflexota bacterium]
MRCARWKSKGIGIFQLAKKAIIIGASSGIGRALAKILSHHGYTVGLAARRLTLVQELQKEIGPGAFVKRIDVSQVEEAMSLLAELAQEMGGVDLVVISAGTGFINQDLIWGREKETIAVNVSGFAAMANVAMHHFLQQGAGHLVSISSIGALRGSGPAPAYNASKAFISTYMQGLRQRVFKLKVPITITDIQPGFVDTAMAKGEGMFWVASPEKAAEQIYQVIRKKKTHAYITKRWRLIAWFFRLAPDCIYNRMG